MTPDDKDKYYDSDRDPKVWLLRIIGLIVALIIFFFLFVYPHTRMKYEKMEEKYSLNAQTAVFSKASTDGYVSSTLGGECATHFVTGNTHQFGTSHVAQPVESLKVERPPSAVIVM